MTKRPGPAPRVPEALWARVSVDVRKRVDALAKRHDVSVAQVVRWALDEGLVVLEGRV